MRAMINKLIAYMAIIIIVSTPWRVCNAESSRSGRMELGASFLFLGGESVSVDGAKIEEDDWTMYGITLGKNINEHLNFNTEIVFGSIDVDVSGLPAGSTIDGDQYTLIWLANMDYNILAEPLTPYITGGIGWGHSEAEVDFSTPTSSGTIEDDTSGFAYTVGFGGRWDITENIFAKVSYRIVWDDEGDDRSGLGITAGFLF